MIRWYIKLLPLPIIIKILKNNLAPYTYNINGKHVKYWDIDKKYKLLMKD